MFSRIPVICQRFNIAGDRIAIMSNGVVQCCGSSLFLKTKYGVGYHMVMVKSENCNVESVTSVVRQYVRGASLENDVGRKLTFLIARLRYDMMVCQFDAICLLI